MPDWWTITYNIREQPHTVIITDAEGNQVNQTSGTISPAKLKRLIRRFFNQHLDT